MINFLFYLWLFIVKDKLDVYHFLIIDFETTFIHKLCIDLDFPRIKRCKILTTRLCDLVILERFSEAETEEVAKPFGLMFKLCTVLSLGGQKDLAAKKNDS